MTRPKTLLEMAGAAGQPVLWDKSVLLLIDHQVEYTAAGGLPLTGIDAAAAEVGRLLAAARKNGAPVIHVRHHGRPGGALFNPDGPGGQFIAGIGPAASEITVTKALPNAFAGTDLDARLKTLGRKELIVAGFQTHMCISATVRSAVDHGYRSVVVAWACATRDLPDPLGAGVMAAADLHRVTLAALSDRFATILPDAGAISVPAAA
ncbi:cysteine hydrolase family protein [Ferrovibrio xuzhouensis]|uniref:Cysteine hydrolase family protein n=1 Tax=Ferrovibrio xuzhouensis TaxID=1576914 RepID=A0ABV7VK28_9PROT